MTNRVRKGGNSEDFQLMYLGDVDAQSGSGLSDGDGLVWNESEEKFKPISVASATDVAEAQLLVLNEQTGTTYQLVAGDYAGNVLVRCTNASPITLTVPAHATVPNVIGAVVGIDQGGTGTVTIAPENGTVTINSKDSLLSLSGQWAPAALICTAQNVWSLIGALA